MRTSESEHWTLNREVANILQRPDVRKRMAQDEIEVKLMTPDAVRQYLESETVRWAPLAGTLAAAGN